MHLYQYLLGNVCDSKKALHTLLKRGVVRINGQIANDAAMEVDGHLHELTIENKAVPLIKHRYYMLNKPQGLITATKDEKLSTVCSLFNEHVWPIGRLDRSTEGLLIVTNHGQMSFRLPLPQYKVRKVYKVHVNGLITDQMVEQFACGVEFYGGIYCAPAKLVVLQADQKESIALVTLTEGKFHQVKKMFLVVGLYVTYLQRIQYGPLMLDHNLQPGAFRHLTVAEIKQLWDAVQLAY